MADPEDRDLSARYRALGDEAPPAALDAAVLAAARAAVAKRPGSGLRRWSLPVSLAAVVVLSVLVTLRVDEERPDVGLPREAPLERLEEKGSEPFSAPAPAPQRRQSAPAVVPAPAPAVQAPSSPAPAVPPASESAARTVEAEARRNDAPGAKPALESGLGAAASGDVAPASKREDAARATAPAREASAPLRAKSADAVPGAALVEPPLPWLERIARLRSEGRIEEAERALAEFRRRHPDYEIPQAMREAVLGKR